VNGIELAMHAVGHFPGGVVAPGTGEVLGPLFDGGMAIDDFAHGDYGEGLFHTGMAVLDVACPPAALAIKGAELLADLTGGPLDMEKMIAQAKAQKEGEKESPYTEADLIQAHVAKMAALQRTMGGSSGKAGTSKANGSPAAAAKVFEHYAD
jgi:hypothetical protein